MNLTELNEKYHAQLSAAQGDQELRYYLLAPLFQNLYQNKVVYHERFTALVQLSEITLTPELFTAKAALIAVIKASSFRKRPLPQTWDLSANWAYLSLNKACLSTYSSWLLWPDPALVQKVETLIYTNQLEEAYELTMRKL